MHTQKKYRPLVYICSKYSGDVSGNTEAAKRYSRFAVDQGTIPLAPHLLLPLYMNEETERELALFMDMVFPGKVEKKYDDPYLQAQYTYSQIGEDNDE